MPSCSNAELVSVVIPTYRGDRFIADSLATIAQQTWPHWEVIVVEDGSAGQTEGIVRQFAADHPQQRIEYVRHEKNQSQSAARNTGMKIAQGKYIALLDVDDRWQPTHLAASLAALRQENADLVYSTVAMFDDATELVFAIWGPMKRELAQFPFSLMQRSFIVPSATVFRRDLIERIGLFEPELSPCEDLDYWIRAAGAGARFAHLKGCHVLYRKNHAEAETRGTCRLTEKYAQVIEKHLTTLKNPRYNYRKLAAKLHFGAAWCHATTRRDQDPTADPARAPALLLKAAQLHHGKLAYRFHEGLSRLSQWCRSDLLRRFHYYWLRPRQFTRFGNLLSPPAG